MRARFSRQRLWPNEFPQRRRALSQERHVGLYCGVRDEKRGARIGCDMANRHGIPFEAAKREGGTYWDRDATCQQRPKERHEPRLARGQHDDHSPTRLQPELDHVPGCTTRSFEELTIREERRLLIALREPQVRATRAARSRASINVAEWGEGFSRFLASTGAWLQPIRVCEHESRVVPAEAKGIAHGDSYGNVTSVMRHVIEIALGIGMIQVDCRGGGLVVDRENRRNGLYASGTPHGMSKHRFLRTYHHAASVRPENCVNRSRLFAVVHLRRCSVRADVVDGVHRNRRVPHRVPHHLNHSVPVRRDRHDVVGI